MSGLIACVKLIMSYESIWAENIQIQAKDAFD